MGGMKSCYGNKQEGRRQKEPECSSAVGEEKPGWAGHVLFFVCFCFLKMNRKEELKSTDTSSKCSVKNNALPVADFKHLSTTGKMQIIHNLV